MGIAETRRGVAVVFLVALAVWWLEALAMPLAQGRDLGTYLGGYIELFQRHPVDLGYVLGRTPGATLLIGGLLQFAGGALAEPVVSLLYAASVAAWFVTARILNTRAALLTGLVLLLYPGYAILFHELSSDAIFGAAFAGWALLAVRALAAPSTRRFAWAGAGIGVLALIRPGNQVLLVLALLPLVLRGAWRSASSGPPLSSFLHSCCSVVGRFTTGFVTTTTRSRGEATRRFRSSAPSSPTRSCGPRTGRRRASSLRW